MESEPLHALTNLTELSNSIKNCGELEARLLDVLSLQASKKTSFIIKRIDARYY